MRGISSTVWIVIVVIVMVVAAVVILNMFGVGISQVATFSEARNICIQQFTTNCMANGVVPPTWSMTTLNVGGEQTSCADLVTCTCEDKVATCS